MTSEFGWPASLRLKILVIWRQEQEYQNNVCIVVEKALAVTKTVNASAEDTGSKELSKLFWYIEEA